MFRWRPPCRKTTSPSSIRWASLNGGMTLSTGCRTRSSNAASSMFGTGRVSVSHSKSQQLKRAYRTRIVTSSTKTRVPQRLRFCRVIFVRQQATPTKCRHVVGVAGERRQTVRPGLSDPRARLRSAQEVLFLGRRLACQLLELRDPHFSIFEHRADLEPAAQSFDVFGQGADTDVGPVLNLRDLSLVDAEDFGELQLRHPLRLSQLIDRHSRQTLLEPLLNPPLPIGRHRFQQFTKTTSGH